MAGAVLTGGASSRMGRDKASLEVGGVTGAERASKLLTTLCDEVVLIGGDPPASAVGRRVSDPSGPRCALRGLVGALDACSAEHVLVLATDLPFATPQLLLALVAWPEADAAVPRNADGAHPLCALYHREPVLQVARRHLEVERLALGALLDAVDTRYFEGDDLAAVDPENAALTNLNTPEEHRAAELRLTRARPFDQ